jgi:hypothetical protein
MPLDQIVDYVERVDLPDHPDNPFIQIYVDTCGTHDELVQTLMQLLAAVPVQGACHVLQTACSEFHILENDDFDVVLRSAFPGGFVHFRYHIDIIVLPNQPRSPAIAQVAALLEYCWLEGYPAVALCDCEEHLPHRGGYNSQMIPWIMPHDPGAVAVFQLV